MPAPEPLGVFDQLLRYGGVGLLATVTHYLVLAAAVEGAGLSPWWASGLGAVVGAQVAYVGNRQWTFRHRGAVPTSWTRFQGTAALGALLGMLIVAWGVHRGWHYLAAQAVATATAWLLTYAVNRSWTFR